MKGFSERVVELAMAIPKGRVSTYGRIARAAGAGPMASQSITSILGKAWESGQRNIPFHRIVYADGRVWIDGKYRKKRLALYKKEKIEIEKGRVKNFRDLLVEF
jgi:alkylated DNA nucleotide flippase Atl1